MAQFFRVAFFSIFGSKHLDEREKMCKFKFIKQKNLKLKLFHSVLKKSTQLQVVHFKSNSW